MSAYRAAPATNAQEAAEWSTGKIIRTNLRAIVGRAYPRVIGLTREPSWIFFEIALPFLAVSAFVFVYRALEAPEDYIGFVVLGGALTAFWLNVVWMMAAQFYWEKDQGNLELYFTAPMHLMAILAGMAIGGLVMTSSRALAVIGIGSLLYGVTYDIQQPLLLAGVFVADDDPALRHGHALRVPLPPVGSRGVPPGGAPPGADLLPGRRELPAASHRRGGRARHGDAAARRRSRRPAAARLRRQRGPGRPSGRCRGRHPRVMGVIFLVAARLALRYLEHLARREGRLTLRWQ